MSQDPDAISEHDLHAYMDGRLDPARRDAVEAYLTTHPEDADRLRDYVLIDQALIAAFSPVLNEPAPARLRRRPYRRTVRRAAAVAAWLLVGGAAGWFGRDYAGVPTVPFTAALVKQAVVAHAVFVPEVRHPVEVSAAQEQHLVAWLSKRLGTEIRAPQLNTLGYELLGGRLLPAEQGPAAQFMYQDAQGRRLTLFVRKGAVTNTDTAFRFAQQGDINAFYWIDRDLGYALVGAMDKGTLSGIAHEVYEQINPPQPNSPAKP